MAGLWVRSIFTVWKMSTTPSYRIRSSTMLSVMKTPVLPTPALQGEAALRGTADQAPVSPAGNGAGPSRAASDPRLASQAPVSPAGNGAGLGGAAHLQWTEMGPSWPNCSLVLCTWPMKSMKPSPDFGTPCSGQSVNWNCRTVRDWPSWNAEEPRPATEVGDGRGCFPSLPTSDPGLRHQPTPPPVTHGQPRSEA